MIEIKDYYTKEEAEITFKKPKVHGFVLLAFIFVNFINQN
jgi:hypothetical protein